MRKISRTSSRLATAVTAVAAAALVATAVSPATHATTWAPTAQEEAVALHTAHLEADSTLPGAGGKVSHAPQSAAPNDWPANVSAVLMIGSSRSNASQFVGDYTSPDDRKVTVIRMVGTFEVATTGPPGSSHVATGRFMTVVVDATSGDVLDFSVTDSPRAMPTQAHGLFQRAA